MPTPNSAHLSGETTEEFEEKKAATEAKAVVMAEKEAFLKA